MGAFVAGLHGDAATAGFYGERLATSGATAGLRRAVDAAIAEARARGPYGSYPAGPLSREDSAGPAYKVGADARRALGPRLAAAFEHVHMLVFHPRDAAPAALQALLDAGLVHDRHRDDLPDRRLPVVPDPGGRRLARSRRPPLTREVFPMAETVLNPPDHTAPVAFTRAQLEWLPWLEPLAADAMTERHLASLVDAARVKSPYFRLLARDPDALEARTRTDKDIFYNPDAGLPRAERELAAAATSRFNGCIYCASVHARFAATYSKREDDVQRLLDDGVDRRPRRALERHRRGLGGPDRHADRVRAGARRPPASRRARRSGDLRRHPCRGVLQLGQPADAVARRAGGPGGSVGGLTSPSA